MKWITDLFKLKKPVVIPNRHIYVKEDQMNQHLQEIEDHSWDSYIRCETSRLFQEWLLAPYHTVQGKQYKSWLMVIKPFRSGYTIYHAKSKKWDGGYIITEEIKRQVNEKINDFTRNNTQHPS